MNESNELPVREVGRRRKSNWDRYADIVRIGKPFWKGRRKGVQILAANGDWISYERGFRRNAPADHR